LREQLRKKSKPKTAVSSSESSSEDVVERKPKQRKSFTPSETAKIEEWFKVSIESGTTPGRLLCKDFIDGTNFDREPKHIQDKVRNIIKQRKK
jgi:hypothetical protein